MSIKQLREETVKQKGLNLTFPLRTGLAGAFETNKTTIDAVKDDLRILLLTNHGERLIYSDFGANLRGLLFENMSQDFEVKIQDSIVVATEKWMPFITIKDIQVKTGQTDLSLGSNETKIKIFFSVNNSNLEDSLEIRLKV